MQSCLYQSEKKVPEEEKRILRRKQRELRKQLSLCVYGEKKAATYVRQMILHILSVKYELSDSFLEGLIPFSNVQALSGRDCFLILLMQYEKKYEKLAFSYMVKDGNLMEQPRITDHMIHELYERKAEKMDLHEKTEVLVQRIFEDYKGMGPIDRLQGMELDGISAGLTGQDDYGVFLFYKGKSIAMPCLTFTGKKDFLRVCRNIGRYEYPGQLSEKRGYLVNHLPDGSRVTVARPPFCESWVFFIRQFERRFREELEELLTDRGKEWPILLIRWIVKGCQVTAVTGAQGAGKTTLLTAMIGEIPESYHLRVHEAAFELQLRKKFPERNIMSIQETEVISGQEGLNFLKKTDGDVTIIGEVASAEISNYLVQTAQMASLFTLFTHHARTTKALVSALRNALLQTGIFENEMAALEQVIDVVRFDIHLARDASGHRYVERISEIIPKEGGYRIQNLVEYREGNYVVTGVLSQNVREEIRLHLTREEKAQYEEDLHQMDWRSGQETG